MLPDQRTPTHPGEILLEDFLKPAYITQKQFSMHMNWTFTRVNEFVNCKRGVSADTALGLSEAFGNNPEFWLNLQNNWDLWHAKQGHVSKPRITDNYKDKGLSN